MPIEIRELIIKANISEQPAAAQSTSVSTQQLEDIKAQIKKECIEELKQFIKDQNER